MSRQLFYVAASSGRTSVTVVTSDQELLRASVGRSDERQSASELIRNRVLPRPAGPSDREAYAREI